MTCSSRQDLPKFVVTPSMFLPRRLATSRDEACGLRSDAWDGYPRSLHAFLKHICDHEVRHLVFLSGDEHVGCVAKVRVSSGNRSAVFHSVHCPALYAPYPFANAVKEDFARVESFEFHDDPAGPIYRCSVEVENPPPGDGFVLIDASPADATAAPEATFVGGRAPDTRWSRHLST